MGAVIYHVEAVWDPEAGVWVAESEDVPGLVTEADTIEVLTDKLRVMVPELLEANEVVPSGSTVSFELTTHRQELVKLAS